MTRRLGGGAGAPDRVVVGDDAAGGRAAATHPADPRRLVTGKTTVAGGFVLVWTALLVFRTESLHHYRRTRRRAGAGDREPARLVAYPEDDHDQELRMALQDPEELRTWLEDADFPAGKEALIGTAQKHRAPEHVVEALRTIPDTDYANRDEVLAATPRESSQTDAEKSQQARHHTHGGLAEGERKTPTNPIVDELGENRGS